MAVTATTSWSGATRSAGGETDSPSFGCFDGKWGSGVAFVLFEERRETGLVGQDLCQKQRGGRQPSAGLSPGWGWIADADRQLYHRRRGKRDAPPSIAGVCRLGRWRQPSACRECWQRSAERLCDG